MKIEMSPIGIINTPYDKLEGMPIQPAGAAGIIGTVEVYKKYQKALSDLDGFSHIILLYFFHKSANYSLRVTPFMDSVQRGLFSTRAPKRPNPIGISIVHLEKISDNFLYVQNVDMLNGTPLLDIKPYIPEFEPDEVIKCGWLEHARKTVDQCKSDNRFK